MVSKNQWLEWKYKFKSVTWLIIRISSSAGHPRHKLISTAYERKILCLFYLLCFESHSFCEYCRSLVCSDGLSLNLRVQNFQFQRPFFDPTRSRHVEEKSHHASISKTKYFSTKSPFWNFEKVISIGLGREFNFLTVFASRHKFDPKGAADWDNERKTFFLSAVIFEYWSRIKIFQVSL